MIVYALGGLMMLEWIVGGLILACVVLVIVIDLIGD